MGLTEDGGERTHTHVRMYVLHPYTAPVCTFPMYSLLLCVMALHVVPLYKLPAYEMALYSIHVRKEHTGSFLAVYP